MVPILMALGLQRSSSKTLQSMDDWSRCTVTPAANDSISVVYQEGVDNGVRHRWIFASSKPELRSYQLELFTYGKWGKVKEARNSDFITVDGISLPRKISWTKSRSDGTVETQMKIEVEKYLLGNDVKEDRLPIFWPRGTRVKDQRHQQEFVVREDNQLLTDKVITDEYIWVPEPEFRTSRLLIAILVFGGIIGLVLLMKWLSVREKQRRYPS